MATNGPPPTAWRAKGEIGLTASRRRHPTLVVLVFAALALAACQQASGPATPQEIALGAMTERSRGHLANAVGLARAGRWDLAAVHAAHPAETMQAVNSALSKRDAKAAGALRAGTDDIVAAAQAKDLPRLEALVADVDAQYARIPAAVMGADRASELPYRASVVAALAESVADEYGEAVVNGKLAEEAEYQDAYAFLGRASAIWSEIGPAVAAKAAHEHEEIAEALEGLSAALPSLEPPATPAPADEVAALAATVRGELNEAVGVSTAVAGSGAFVAASERLDAALAEIDEHDASAAAREVRGFMGAWGAVEGTVKAKSADAYTAIENDTAAAISKLGQQPPDLAGARAAVEDIRTRLEPFVVAPTTYGAFDAAVILLREGLEALLVVAALLAFLVQSGNGDKRGWVWAGGGAGVLASVGVAVGVNLAFSASASTGVNPEIIEGVTGLFAAAMLVYVSYWMHSKANLSTWQRYIRDKTSSALARNSLLSLALIAFLAVFREGAETVLFYLGIASSIALGQLVLGLAIGAGALVAIGVAMIVLGLRIPVRPFFLVASLLIYYLGFKFVGSGIHALQVAGLVPATPSGTLPGIDLIGMYPTWETTAIQVALLAAAVAFVLYERARERRPEAVSAA